MVEPVDSASELSLPSSSTFSFISPFPTSTATNKQTLLKQRRVSLALPSSPRLVPAWSFRDDTSLDSYVASGSGLIPEKKGKMRKIASDEQRPFEKAAHTNEKRQRKKWSEEETQMLVDGCQTWGVGNWKAILNDPNLVFDNRSPVDLKDRFRTFFPDAYKQHYPNAKTHLSSKVRSTLPDGSSMFEKTRSKKRRPFTVEEDQALRAGYEKYGTVWSTIVKDPIFQDQKRRSTDLRDRFRNAFPDLYQAAGYKPRTIPKKKRHDDVPGPIRAATDDQYIPTRMRNPARRRRACTSPGMSRSVPQSAACSEDEDSSGAEDDIVDIGIRPPFVPTKEVTPQREELSYPTDSSLTEMFMHPLDTLSDPLIIPDFMTSTSLSMSDMTPDSSQSQTWSSGGHSPPHIDGWSSATTTASPTSSQLSTDYFAKDYPFTRRSDSFNMIGKSAWGPSDWLSGNPRLDPSATSSSSSSYISGPSPTPSSPFSFSNLNHGIMDRYDLFRTSFAHDFASEAGMGDTHSTFSDPDMFPTQTFRGFTHHSDYAGDLIFGARTHQPQGHMGFGSGLGFGNMGLGLTGVSQPPASINPMQLHTPVLPGIDELELTSITLDDHVEDEVMATTAEVGVQKDDPESSPAYPLDLSALINLPPQTMEEIVGLSSTDPPQMEEMATTPPATPVMMSRSPRGTLNNHHYPSLHARSSSVPPFEHRSIPPVRSLQPHSESSLQTIPPRAASHYDTASHNLWTSLPPTSLVTTPSDAPRSSVDLYDLPFLDLHYFNHSSAMLPPHHDNAQLNTGESRPGQALDLALTQNAHSHSPSNASMLPPSLDIAVPIAGTTRPRSYHQRVQSAVSPKDLLLRKGSDNKRKRVSWDGGAG